MGTKGFMLEEVAELPWHQKPAEHLSPVQIEAGNSQNAYNDAVNSPLAKQTLSIKATLPSHLKCKPNKYVHLKKKKNLKKERRRLD